MLLIHPPVAKACEPPAGIARLAGALRGNGHECSLLDMNLEGQLFLLGLPVDAGDTWSRRSAKNLSGNLDALRSVHLYQNFSRYQRAVADVNRVVEVVGRQGDASISLANYQENLSPLKSDDLLQAANQPEKNIFFPYFSKRLQQLLDDDNSPAVVGFSLNYLSQAVCTFAMIGFLRKNYAGLQIVVGGGLITSWLRNPGWQNPFAGLVDHLVAGPGENPLLDLLGNEPGRYHAPDYNGLPLAGYLAPGFILPYAASSGCWWNRCSFCPETAEGNPYVSMKPEQVLEDIQHLADNTGPALIHFLDNAISPALLKKMIERPPGVQWYGFARVTPELTDMDFCRSLRRSGCVMLKLGLESGDQDVLDAMNKGIDLEMVSRALDCLKEAGIATYVYLLFGTPSETVGAARRTLEFTVQHSEAITFVNLAIFNMPVCGEDADRLGSGKFYEGDLSLYTDFDHPLGWHRREVRRFLDQEFKKHPAIVPIIQRDPPLFTSNHAPFFCWK
jgi:hypothetical protein